MSGLVLAFAAMWLGTSCTQTKSAATKPLKVTLPEGRALMVTADKGMIRFQQCEQYTGGPKNPCEGAKLLAQTTAESFLQYIKLKLLEKKAPLLKVSPEDFSVYEQSAKDDQRKEELMAEHKAVQKELKYLLRIRPEDSKVSELTLRDQVLAQELASPDTKSGPILKAKGRVEKALFRESQEMLDKIIHPQRNILGHQKQRDQLLSQIILTGVKDFKYVDAEALEFHRPYGKCEMGRDVSKYYIKVLRPHATTMLWFDATGSKFTFVKYARGFIHVTSDQELIRKTMKNLLETTSFCGPH